MSKGELSFMRKILLSLFILLICPNVMAENWDSAAALKRVNTIGNKLLQANGVKQPVQFRVSNDEDMNAYANGQKEIYVFKGLLLNVTNNEELAGVIAHETGHIINGHVAKQTVLGTGVNVLTNVASMKYNSTALAVGNTLATSKLSRHDEFEADLTGVDLMVKAGYNPLAMISLLNKISGNYVDILESHPSGEKRLLNIYNYVEYNYPNSIKKGFNSDSYKKALTIITPAVQKRQNSARLTKKYKKEQEKLLKRKAKRMTKMAKNSTMWDGTYNMLLNLSGESN